jgi:hypothetical protein
VTVRRGATERIACLTWFSVGILFLFIIPLVILVAGHHFLILGIYLVAWTGWFFYVSGLWPRPTRRERSVAVAAAYFSVAPQIW